MARVPIKSRNNPQNNYNHTDENLHATEHEKVIDGAWGIDHFIQITPITKGLAVIYRLRWHRSLEIKGSKRMGIN